jgi:hypothetical protein
MCQARYAFAIVNLMAYTNLSRVVKRIGHTPPQDSMTYMEDGLLNDKGREKTSWSRS